MDRIIAHVDLLQIYKMLCESNSKFIVEIMANKEICNMLKPFMKKYIISEHHKYQY